MLAAKGRTLLVLLALGLAVATALPAAASLPRSGRSDRLDVAPAALFAAAAAEPEPAPTVEPHRFALLDEPPGDRFELLDPASIEHVAFTGRPPRPHLFPELETRLRASTFSDPSLLEPIGFQLPDCLELAPIGAGLSCQGSYFALNNPINFSDPMGLACPECTKQLNRDSKASREKARREALESLVFETQWFLAENEFSSHEEALEALGRHLAETGFAPKDHFEGLRLATQLIGPADCDGSGHVVCHMGGGRAFAKGIEFGVTQAVLLLVPELAFSELAVGGTSYVAMLEAAAR